MLPVIHKTHGQSTDEELISSIKKGDARLYEIIVRRYNPYLYKIGRSYRLNHEDTQDQMQNTYLNAFYHLEDFHQRSSFKTWLSSIMIRHCYHFMKNQKSKLTISSDAAKEEWLNKSESGDMITRMELNHIIENILNDLPEMYRIVFALRELNQHSVEESARLLGISETNVKVRLLRAKNMIRRKIESAYHPDSIYTFLETYCNRMVDRVMKQILE